MSSRCLVCQKTLLEHSQGYHRRCGVYLFSSVAVPAIGYDRKELRELAKQVVAQQITVPGVQEKLSLIQRVTDGEKRLTLVGLDGEFILKAPADQYPQMPENEAATMAMARLCGIETAPSGLIALSDGSLAYLTRRFDRKQNRELHMEDMCQLTERLTEDKYKGSVEQVGKVLLACSSRPGYDLLTLFDLTVFCFLTGNGDMHLKNYAVLHEPALRLAPAFDLLNTRLLITESKDRDDAALAVNGKRRKLKRDDFLALSQSLRLVPRQAENVLNKYRKLLPKMIEHMNSSFLSPDFTAQYQEIMRIRAGRLFDEGR